jgi:hypothetical protein
VVDKGEAVGRAIKRLLRSVGIGANANASDDEFFDTLASVRSYRPGRVILGGESPRRARAIGDCTAM